MNQNDLNNKKVVNAWAIFDWANSAYALVISTAVFPVFFIEYTPDNIEFLGWDISNSALYSFAVSFSYIVIACLSPLLSGIADYSGKKMFFMKVFTLIGSLSCIALFWFKDESQLWLGTAGFILATIGFAGGLVFYNAYLPQIVTEDRYDKVSAKGFAFGYIGSVLLLIIILVMVLQPQWFGITSPNLPHRIGFALVGVWWLGFAQYTFKHLPKDKKQKLQPGVMKQGYIEVSNVFKKVMKNFNIRRFLIAFFLYSAGVQTVIYLATIFAKEVLNFETAELILTVLIIQLVGIGGAYLFAHVSKLKGNKFSLSVQLVIWIAVCITAYFTEGKMLFYVLAGMVGMVMGGIQSLSRSSYSKLIEKKVDDLTSYFSFYDVLYKISIVAGTFIFGLVQNVTNNMRYSVLSLTVFFILGLIALSSVTFSSPERD